MAVREVAYILSFCASCAAYPTASRLTTSEWGGGGCKGPALKRNSYHPFRKPHGVETRQTIRRPEGNVDGSENSLNQRSTGIPSTNNDFGVTVAEAVETA